MQIVFTDHKGSSPALATSAEVYDYLQGAYPVTSEFAHANLAQYAARKFERADYRGIQDVADLMGVSVERL